MRIASISAAVISCVILQGCDKENPTLSKKHETPRTRSKSSGELSRHDNRHGLSGDVVAGLGVLWAHGSDSIAVINQLSALAKDDPKAALEFFSNPVETENFNFGFGFAQVASIVAQNNPALLEDWLLNDLAIKDDRKNLPFFAKEGFNKLGKFAPENAIRALTSIKLRSSEIGVSLDGAFLGMGTEDPEAALLKVGALGPSFDDRARMAVASGAAEISPQKGVAIASSIIEPGLRQDALGMIYSSWLYKEPEKAAASIQALDLKTREKILMVTPQDSNSVVSRLARNNPEVLFETLAAVPPSASNKELFKSSYDFLLKDHPDQVLRSISSLPESNLKTDITRETFARLADVDPMTAFSKAVAGGDSSARRAGLEGIAPSFGRDGLDKTLATMQGLGAEEKVIFLTGAFKAVIDVDVDAAKNYLDTIDAQPVKIDKKAQNAIYSRTASKLASQDLANAKAWVAAVPSNAQVPAMRGLALSMAKEDISGLASYVNSLPQNELWAEGARVIVEAIAGTDRVAADEWRKSLSEYSAQANASKSPIGLKK